ncbi:uncharacterized protein J8A68_002390 [[Candida] subhashii]|uniref:SUN-like protein 1 n=1 Tax=[Candida] subhashii TaxID=561895 RepID=A0A8J5UP68_9ASCO|nr:uncharacterized protein J8A68_002390 [[Candida] subhashii]KAG7664066.1 hypothetical protein J8A68_002390 [[Candida] subhashii]
MLHSRRRMLSLLRCPTGLLILVGLLWLLSSVDCQSNSTTTTFDVVESPPFTSIPSNSVTTITTTVVKTLIVESDTSTSSIISKASKSGKIWNWQKKVSTTLSKTTTTSQRMSPLNTTVPNIFQAHNISSSSSPLSLVLNDMRSSNSAVPIISTSSVSSQTQLLQQLHTQQDTNNTHNTNNNISNIIDECHFMSFEEWKKHKIEAVSNNTDSPAASQLAPSISSSTSPQLVKNQNSTRLKNNTSNKTSTPKGISTSKEEVASSGQNQTIIETEGKLYKDKFNYASADCAATVVKTNKNAKGASAILKENKDSYLLNQCSIPDKFVIIELCQDILVQQVVIGNFEFFSSMFKDVKISVSDRFPTSNWKLLGEFVAENKRDIQTFRIENPLIWARYLKIEILSHYGSEFYCPISVVRVHGKTMMDEFKEDEEKRHMEKNEEKVIEQEVQPETNNELDFLYINSSLANDFKVFMPHLDLNAFLKDINGTNITKQICTPNTTNEPITTTASSTTQESIYKNIMKRLSLLESNATLSLLYIEEQSKLLSLAFSNLEKKQKSNFNTLINSVNITLINQLLSFRDSYNTLHEQYRKLYHVQESNHRELLLETNKKLGVLTGELVFQKRVVMFNSIIIMCLLVYVVLTRDVEIIQQPENIDDSGRGEPASQSVMVDGEVLVKSHPASKSTTTATTTGSSPFRPFTYKHIKHKLV